MSKQPTPAAAAEPSGVSTEPGFARRLAAYAGSTLLLRMFRLAYAYAKPKFLLPAQLGLWNLLSLIPQYASFLQLGSSTAMSYRIPRLRAEENGAEAERVKATVYHYTRGYNLVVAALLLAVAALVDLGPDTRLGLATLAPFVLLTWYHDYQLYLLKAEMRFGIISRANVVNAFALVLIGVPLVAFYGLYGVFAGALLAKGAVVAYLARAHPLRIGSGFEFPLLKELILEGLPITVFAFSLVLLGTSDRLIVGGLLGEEALGYYAIALVAAGFILQIPVSARDMLEPKLMAQMAQNEPGKVWHDYFRRPLVKTATLFPLLLGPAAFLTEPALRLLLPNYVQSAEATVVLAFGCYFLALVQVIRGVLIAFRWQMRTLPFQVLGIAFNVGASFLLIRAGWGITGVAAASALAFALVLLLTLVFVLHRSPYSTRESWRLAPPLLLPFLYSAGAAALIARHLPELELPAVADPAVGLLLFLPGAYLIRRFVR